MLVALLGDLLFASAEIMNPHLMSVELGGRPVFERFW
jgi:hypothetical protein